MSRDATSKPSPARCVLVWLAVTAGAVATASTAGATAARLATSTAWQGTFDGLIVAIAAGALLLCSSWLWLVTSITVLGLITGRSRHHAVGLTRRLVLIACGAVVVAGVGNPAVAGSWSAGGAADELAGLALPDRAVASAPWRPAPPASAPHATKVGTSPPPPPGFVTVRAGDSLWSIAASALPRGASPAEVDAAWRALYAANHETVGADPDLIQVGTELFTHPIHNSTVDPQPREARP